MQTETGFFCWEKKHKKIYSKCNTIKKIACAFQWDSLETPRCCDHTNKNLHPSLPNTHVFM